MRKLGDGLQYVAYDAGQGRVFKRITTREEKVAKLKSWKGFTTQKSINEKIKSVNKHLKVSTDTVRKRLAKGEIPSHLLGNPAFVRGLNYTQDKVTPLGAYLKTHTLRQNKKVLTTYILLEHTLWQHGMSDDTRKPTFNNGVRKNGEVILLDFGECAFQKRTIASYIWKKKWLPPYSHNALQDARLQDFMAKLIAKEITIQKLNHYWRQKVS